MKSRDSEYRLKIADGFLKESLQDIGLNRWRSCVDNAQLAVENAAKAVLALVYPIGRTHSPSVLLKQAMRDNLFLPEHSKGIERLAGYSELLGIDIHIQTDYGDESLNLTPWEIFNEEDARNAAQIAADAVREAKVIITDITARNLFDKDVQ